MYIFCVFTTLVKQCQRLQPLASPKLEILPPGPPSKLETYKIMQKCAQSAHHEREARSPLRPGSRARLRALEAQGSRCSLVQSEPYFGSILSQQIYLFILIINLLQLEQEKIKLKRESGRFCENSPQQLVRVGVSAMCNRTIYIWDFSFAMRCFNTDCLSCLQTYRAVKKISTPFCSWLNYFWTLTQTRSIFVI